MAEDYLSESDLQVVKVFLTEELRSTARRGVPMADIFENVKELINLSDDDKVDFCKGLSVAINGNKLPELEVKKGPGGGVGFKGKNPTTTKLVSSLPEKKVAKGNPTKAAEVSDAPVPEKSYVGTVVELPKAVIPKAVIKDRYDLWIGETVFEVPYSKAHVKSLLIDVFNAEEDNDGVISFEGVKYKIGEDAKSYLDKLMFYFYGASVVQKSNEVKRAL